MAVTVEQADLFGWSGYRLSAGKIAVGVAPAIGGRIVSLTHLGEELLYVQPEQRGEVVDLQDVRDLRAKKRELGFRLWGGDKTWAAPQSAWWEGTPPLDLDAGRYDAALEDRAVRLTSPACRETGLRVVRRVELREDGEIVLDQQFVNTTEEEVRRGIWDVTQCRRPFDVHVAAGSVRPYAEEGDSVRLHGTVVAREGEWVRIACREAAHFKFGGLAVRGTVVALRPDAHGTLAFVRSFQTDPHARYAHDASVEVYNSPDHDYLEIEVHAALQPLGPGGAASHRQRWRIGRLPRGTGASEAARALGAG